jgi:hypothetical protein
MRTWKASPKAQDTQGETLVYPFLVVVATGLHVYPLTFLNILNLPRKVDWLE